MKYDVPRLHLALGGWACLFLLLAGCGGDGVPRAAVSGNVTLDGQPLEEGVILFTPLGKGPSAGGDIKQGKYQLPQDKGPGPGSYRVEIRAYRATGETVRDEASGTVEEVKVSIIPPRYNNQSTLAIEVKPAGPNEFDFELTSK
jgi:hypothetical protein